MDDNSGDIQLREWQQEDAKAILRINQQCRPDVAALDRAELERLQSMGARVIVAVRNVEVVGYLILFSSDAPYDGEEFRAFRRAQTGEFLYIDQLAVATECRRTGIAQRLYGALADGSLRLPKLPLCCEVNLQPPNPASLAFHERMGFSVLTQMKVSDGRLVALMIRRTGTVWHDTDVVSSGW